MKKFLVDFGFGEETLIEAENVNDIFIELLKDELTVSGKAMFCKCLKVLSLPEAAELYAIYDYRLREYGGVSSIYEVIEKEGKTEYKKIYTWIEDGILI